MWGRADKRAITFDGYIYRLARVCPIIHLELLLRKRVFLGWVKVRSFRLHHSCVLFLVFISLRRRNWLCCGLRVDGEAVIKDEWKGKRKSVECEFNWPKDGMSSHTRNAFKCTAIAELPLAGPSRSDTVQSTVCSGAWKVKVKHSCTVHNSYYGPVADISMHSSYPLTYKLLPNRSTTVLTACGSSN